MNPSVLLVHRRAITFSWVMIHAQMGAATDVPPHDAACSLAASELCFNSHADGTMTGCGTFWYSPSLPALTHLHVGGELVMEEHALAVLAACPALESLHLVGVYQPAYPRPAMTVATLLAVGRLCRRLRRVQLECFPYEFFLPSTEQLQAVSSELSRYS